MPDIKVDIQEHYTDIEAALVAKLTEEQWRAALESSVNRMINSYKQDGPLGQLQMEFNEAVYQMAVTMVTEIVANDNHLQYQLKLMVDAAIRDAVKSSSDLQKVIVGRVVMALADSAVKGKVQC